MILQVLGIVGALDPHMHKTNQASLSGEGKLDLEGVRPLRFHQSTHAGGPEGGRTAGGGGGEGGNSPLSSTMGECCVRFGAAGEGLGFRLRSSMVVIRLNCQLVYVGRECQQSRRGEMGPELQGTGQPWYC